MRGRSWSIEKRHWPLAAVLVLLAALSLTSVLDRRASVHYDELFARALVTFALARTLNGIISAVQGTELALQPAGVGVTLTPGEILDPVNDLVERFSWIMLGATVSLGIQQVLLEVSAWWIVQGLVVVLAFWLLAWRLFVADGSREHRRGQRLLIRALLVAVFLRFAVPLTLIANDAMYRIFLEPRYVASTEVIVSAGQELEALEEQPAEPPAAAEAGDESFFGQMFGVMGRAFEDTATRMDLGRKVERIQARAAEMIEHVIQLSVVFILQTALLPIAFLWLFLQMARGLFRPLRR